MKQITLALLLVSITILSFGQRRIKKLEVNENGYKTNITYTPIVNEIDYNGIKIKIIPISADKLNSQFLQESNINGKFEYTYYDKSRTSYFLKKRKKKREKSDFEFLHEGAVWLLDNEKISQYEYDELVKQIIYYYDKKKGNEIYSTDRIISSNPYYIQGKYLSVFKIEFSNPSKSPLPFNGLLTIQNGNSIYRPLPVDFITNELQKSNLLNVNKAFILERHNFQKPIVIPPYSSFDKFFAVMPINYTDKYLEITLLDSDDKFNYEINKEEKIINESYTYYEFNIEWAVSPSSIYFEKNFNLLKCNQSSVFLGDNELFIDENKLNENFEIFTLALWGEYLYYGRNSNLKGKDFIDKEKNKRSTVVLKTEKIAELKKKVKQ